MRTAVLPLYCKEGQGAGEEEGRAFYFDAATEIAARLLSNRRLGRLHSC
jgi:hypothetical protein